MFKSSYIVETGMGRRIYVGVWATLFLALLPIAALLSGFGADYIPLASLLAIIIGFHSLRTIHKNEKFFAGVWIVYPCIVVSSVVVMAYIALFALVYFTPVNKPVSISTDEEAVKYAVTIADVDVSSFGTPTVMHKSISAFAEKLQDTGVNASDVFIVSWEKADGNFTRLCGTTFTNEGLIVEDFACVLR